MTMYSMLRVFITLFKFSYEVRHKTLSCGGCDTYTVLFTVNLPCYAMTCHLLFVGGPMYQGSQSFICVGGYGQRSRRL